VPAAPATGASSEERTMNDSGAFEPDLTLWDAWQPAEIAHRLRDVQVIWYVAAGWAIDLFLGAQRREHEDLEIAVPRDQFETLARVFDAFELFVPVGDGDGKGLVWPIAAADDFLAEHHQTWVREPATGRWRLDIFRVPADGATWVCRRDERIRLPYAALIERTADGIPYSRPEVVLLFKAKAARPKDEADFAAVLPRLDPQRRAWLTQALALVHPDHPWLDQLT